MLGQDLTVRLETGTLKLTINYIPLLLIKSGRGNRPCDTTTTTRTIEFDSFERYCCGQVLNPGRDSAAYLCQIRGVASAATELQCQIYPILISFRRFCCFPASLRPLLPRRRGLSFLQVFNSVFLSRFFSRYKSRHYPQVTDRSRYRHCRLRTSGSCGAWQ